MFEGTLSNVLIVENESGEVFIVENKNSKPIVSEKKAEETIIVPIPDKPAKKRGRKRHVPVELDDLDDRPVEIK